MQRIRILPETLSNMIAAGEVVERPASVVKELVENSIDAGSSRIDVTVRDGGKRLIRVADNGSGMGREDALLCLERHATSKIGKPSDLESISTMGFRGEALASIASVSRMTVSTKEGDALEGTEVITEGGVVKEVRAAGIPGGTIVEVRDLFFNTPARKKFLRTTATELGHIGDYLARTAIAFPAIAFTFKSDGKTILDLPGAADTGERLHALFGRDDAGRLMEIDEEGGSMKVTGFISPPTVQRSTASSLYIYVNGRIVKDRVIRHAILQGYESFIMKGRFPVALLFVEVPPEEVDVNVHPAKSEVRFRNAGAVHSLVSSAVEKALREKEWLGGESAPAGSERVKEAAALYMAREEERAEKETTPFMERRSIPGALPPGESRDGGMEEGRELAPERYFSSLEVIGQLGGMYILCQGRDGLVIIDQHAAYERIAFEELKAGYEGRSPDVQKLLIPETVDLPPRAAAAVKENLGYLRELGFHVDHFGGRSFVIEAVPAVIGTAGAGEMIADIGTELAEGPASRRFAHALDGILKRLACHSVIRGRRRMRREEMEDLLRRMDAAGIVPHCPHGRPARIVLTMDEIEKRFERS